MTTYMVLDEFPPSVHSFSCWRGKWMEKGYAGTCYTDASTTVEAPKRKIVDTKPTPHVDILDETA